MADMSHPRSWSPSNGAVGPPRCTCFALPQMPLSTLIQGHEQDLVQFLGTHFPLLYGRGGGGRTMHMLAQQLHIGMEGETAMR